MKQFTIEPLAGIKGGVQFGMTRDEARRALAPDLPDHFSRGSPKIDSFYRAALRVAYDQEGKAEFIEFAHDAAQQVLLEGISLFTVYAAVVVEKLKEKHTLSSDETDAGYLFRFPAIELSLWRPVIPDEGTQAGRYFETVGIGCAGYYRKNE